MSKITGILCTGYGAYFTKKGDAMNAEQLLNQVEEAIKNRPTSVAKKYWLIYRQGKIMCLPVAPPGPDAVILETLHPKDLEEGLTLEGWSKIASKLSKIEKEKTT